MRRTDESVLTPRERDEVERMLHTVLALKETMRSFDEGDISLRDAVAHMVAVVSALRAA